MRRMKDAGADAADVGCVISSLVQPLGHPDWKRCACRCGRRSGCGVGVWVEGVGVS